jgi:hypothetical protein
MTACRSRAMRRNGLLGFSLGSYIAAEPPRAGKSVGAETEFVPYPGKAHGFDFSDTDPMTSDAIDRVTRFFKAKLAA